MAAPTFPRNTAEWPAGEGPIKAIVAIERVILIAIWHMASSGRAYRDPGPDFYTRLNPDRAKNRALAQLRSMGLDVTITPTTTPVVE